MWPLFSCEMCGRRYRYKSHLCRHRRYECGQEPQFPCLLCPYKAKRKEHLQQHLRFRHSWREYHSVYACCALTRLRAKSNYSSVFASNTPEDRNHIAHVCYALSRLSVRICSSIFASDTPEDRNHIAHVCCALTRLSAKNIYSRSICASDTLEEKTTTSVLPCLLRPYKPHLRFRHSWRECHNTSAYRAHVRLVTKSSYIVYPLQTPLLKKITRVRTNFALATLMAKSISITASNTLQAEEKNNKTS